PLSSRCSGVQIMLLQCQSLLSFSFQCSSGHLSLHLSLHDALPISLFAGVILPQDQIALQVHYANPETARIVPYFKPDTQSAALLDRKSTRLNSSHGSISYAVFCLKKKTEKYTTHLTN